MSSKTNKAPNKAKSTAWYKDERFKKTVGLALVLFAIFQLVAFTSFLFTWKSDQDVIRHGFFSLLFNNELQVQNWLGKTGALVSHLFIHEWFGIISFVFVYLFLLVGFKVLTGISLFSISKSFKNSFYLIVWTSVSFAYLFDTYYFMGGSFGYFINNWMLSVIGSIGTAFLLAFMFFIYLVFYHNLSFVWLKNIALFFIGNKSVDEENQTSTETEILGQVKADEPFVDDEIEVTPPLESLKNSVIVDFDDEEETVPTSEHTLELEQNEIEENELSIEPSTIEKDEKETSSELQLDIAEVEVKESELSTKEVDKLQQELTDYDPTLDLSSYQMPSVELLENYGSDRVGVDREELEANKDRIVKTLANYNIEIAKIKATIGPTVTLYEIVPAAGVRISKIKNLEDDIALSLSALGIRIIAPIPGKGTIGIEVPNLKPEMVSMRSVISSDKFQHSNMELPLALGKTISNETYVVDLAKMPHLLMAGATGQGKSVGLNAILVSLLYKKHPSQVKFVMVDPKKVELTLFNKIERHFLAKLPNEEEPIITDTKKVINTLNSLCIEMDNRYELLKEAQVRNIKEYNTKFISRKLNPENGHKFLPYIVVVIDEFADLIMTAGKEVETPIARIAQLARAVGIHLIIATQRPSVNIITGTIKANFPARIAFRVSAKIDSRTILDTGGADQLIGKGDMLISNGSEIIRLQCAFVDTPEVDKITEFIGSQRAYPDAFILPEYIDESAESVGSFDDMDRDSMFDEAARIVVQHQQGSASLLQRRLKLGYNRAGRIVDQLEAAGIIGPFEGSKARQVLISDLNSLEQLLASMR